MGRAPVTPRELAGTFTRTVTQSHLDRTAKNPGRQTDASLPPGDWTMKLNHGLLTFDDPNGSGGGEAFSATPTRLKLWAGPNGCFRKTGEGSSASTNPQQLSSGPSQASIWSSPAEETALTVTLSSSVPGISRPDSDVAEAHGGQLRQVADSTEADDAPD